jgi:hypothetical protein
MISKSSEELLKSDVEYLRGGLHVPCKLTKVSLTDKGQLSFSFKGTDEGDYETNRPSNLGVANINFFKIDPNDPKYDEKRAQEQVRRMNHIIHAVWGAVKVAALPTTEGWEAYVEAVLELASEGSDANLLGRFTYGNPKSANAGKYLTIPMFKNFLSGPGHNCSWEPEYEYNLYEKVTPKTSPAPSADSVIAEIEEMSGESTDKVDELPF